MSLNETMQEYTLIKSFTELCWTVFYLYFIILIMELTCLPSGVKNFEEASNSVALVRTQTIPTERPPPVGEVSANFCG